MTVSDIAQWTKRLGRNHSRWIWHRLPSEACTFWHCDLQGAGCQHTWRSVLRIILFNATS